MIRVFVGVIRIYQRGISRFLPAFCRFHPTCSSYAVEALERHGFFRGVSLAVSRILRCHPFHAGGFDPVPPNE
jgi:putative membrane protein insertion efficiency factor